MVTSGTYTFDLSVAEAVDEAYERNGIDPALLTMRHLRSARRSLQLLFVEWATKSIHLWAVEQQTQALTNGDASYDCPAATLNVLEMVVRRTGVDTPVHPMDRDEYLAIPNKTAAGLPTKFYFDRQRVTPTITLWNVPENSIDTLIYYRMRRLQDVGSPALTTDVPYVWLEAMISGLSAKLAVKYAVDRVAGLTSLAENSFSLAKKHDRERVDTQFSVA